MEWPIISRIGHAGLCVRDLDAALWTATNLMGLREVERADGWVYLTHGRPHHTLQLREGDVDGVDHLALEAAGPRGLAGLRSRLESASIPILQDGPGDVGVDDGLTFEGPEGFVFEVFVGMSEDQPPFAPTGVRPIRFGHFNVFVTDTAPMIELLEGVLDFRVTDYVGSGAFMRCNADHHGIGVAPADSPRLHHYAWEIESIADLSRLGDLLDEHGRHLEWGPVRHGVGKNVAAYFVDSSGLLVEFYCQLEQVRDEASFVPGRWDREDPRFYSLWSRDPVIGIRDHGLRPLEFSSGHTH